MAGKEDSSRPDGVIYISLHTEMPPLQGNEVTRSSYAKASVKLTTAQRNWLEVAKLAGCERGFNHAPTPTLRKLEELGLIRRNPATTAKRTLWRITQYGKNYAENQST